MILVKSPGIVGNAGRLCVYDTAGTDYSALPFEPRTANDFVLVEFFHFVAGRPEVFAGIEFGKLGSEYLADCSCHCETAVRVDINLADCALGCLAEFFFGDTDCVGELAAVFVDFFNVFLRNGA